MHLNPDINFTSKKVLVTGGTGLVGAHLIEALVSESYHVRALYRSNIPAMIYSEKVDWVQGDILDVITLEEAMRGVDEVYHCAAVVSFNPKDVGQMYKVNIEGTANVVNACIVNNVARLCYVSSVAALGRIRNGVEINELMTWTPETSNSEYGKSKYLAEMEVWRGIGEGLNAVIVNPSIILGAGDWSTGSTKLFKSVYDEFPWYTEGTTGFVDVLDVVKAMIGLMENNVNAQRFIVSGENTTYRQLFNEIAQAFGKKAPHKKVTPFIAGVVWRLEKLKAMFSGANPLLTKETALTAQATVRYNNTKLFRYLPGFAYTPLKQTVASICKQLQHKYKL